MKPQGMSSIVKVAARLATGFILMFALYEMMYGHLHPGFGFDAGMLLAAALLLLLLAFGKDTVFGLIGENAIRMIYPLAALALLLIGLLGYLGSGFAPGMFGYNFAASGPVYAPSPGFLIAMGLPLDLAGARVRTLSPGVVPFANVAITMMVGPGVFGVLAALAIFHSTRRSKTHPTHPKE